MNPVARYKLNGYDCGMEATHDGAWVSHFDYAALLDTLAANVKAIADAHDRVDVLNETIASYSQVISAKESSLAEIMAENERLARKLAAGDAIQTLVRVKRALVSLNNRIDRSLASRSLGLLDGEDRP